MKQASLSVVFASIYHIAWGILVLIYAPEFSGHTIPFTASVAVHNIFPNYIVRSMVLMVSALIALVGWWYRKRHPLYALFLVPQFTLLSLSAGSALNAVISGHYGDFVQRPWQFIFLDQLPVMALCTMYFLAVIIRIVAGEYQGKAR